MVPCAACSVDAQLERADAQQLPDEAPRPGRRLLPQQARALWPRQPGGDRQVSPFHWLRSSTWQNLSFCNGYIQAQGLVQ